MAAAYGRPDLGGLVNDIGPTSFEVVVYGVEERVRRRSTSYRLRWKVAGKIFPATFKSWTLAEGRRSELLAAARKGVAFHVETGLPVTEVVARMEAEAAAAARRHAVTTWFAHASAFTVMRWPGAAPGHRRNLAEALATATPAMFATGEGRPDAGCLREALYAWAYVPGRRYHIGEGGQLVENDPPDYLAEALAWLEENTIPVGEIDAAVARAALTLLGRTASGAAAAASTTTRRRSALYSAFDFAVELALLEANPLDGLQWTRPRASRQVDRRSVVNHDQARVLLAAVAEVEGGRYRRLRVFFACMYYSALRPEEVNELQKEDITLPGGDGWGEFLLSTADPEFGVQWADGGTRKPRELKHRPAGETRPVPIPPHLVRIICEHLDEFGWSEGGYLVRGVRGGPVPTSTYGRAFRLARQAAFTPEQQASPLARSCYDLRHACLSGWLNAGVPATQVAEWAGHSLAMLQQVYAKCVDGQDAAARARIAEALGGDMP